MIDLDEDKGGLGLGRGAVAAIHYEMGRVLSRMPLIPALLAIRALAEGEATGDLAQAAAAGEYVAIDLTLAPLVATGLTLSGMLPAVADADMAQHVVVTAPGLVAVVALAAPGVTVAERPLWDESRRLFAVTIADHAVADTEVIARGPAADALAERMRQDLLLGLSADALGGASAALATTVGYLTMRKQFDRPLAMFQALKHRCADLKARIVAAEALLWQCAGAADARSAQLAGLKALACEVFRITTQEMVQLHGGIGLTEEQHSHLFLKRAALDLWLGGGADALNAEAGRAALAGYG
jgi:alkylation response protein AidB-like acyl-CoA dehydrogenase